MAVLVRWLPSLCTARSNRGRAGLPMPKVYVIPDRQPNAFATGRNPRHAVVCATEGLLRTLPRDEVEAVMAHEMMHVRHRDILIGSVAAMLAATIPSRIRAVGADSSPVRRPATTTLVSTTTFTDAPPPWPPRSPRPTVS